MPHQWHHLPGPNGELLPVRSVGNLRHPVLVEPLDRIQGMYSRAVPITAPKIISKSNGVIYPMITNHSRTGLFMVPTIIMIIQISKASFTATQATVMMMPLRGGPRHESTSSTRLRTCIRVIITSSSREDSMPKSTPPTVTNPTSTTNSWSNSAVFTNSIRSLNGIPSGHRRQPRGISVIGNMRCRRTNFFRHRNRPRIIITSPPMSMTRNSWRSYINSISYHNGVPRGHHYNDSLRRPS
ncbi:hypothetical protein GGS20DRAFT_416371 [Poronia punctata]|nr:hypothetical protein GGS20DRAFT_416371 [Poronia punctata]